MFAKINRWVIKGFILIISCMALSEAYAADASITYLRQIATNTRGILQAVNNLPALISTIAVSSMSITNPDTSENTAALQAQFTAFSNKLIENEALRLSLQDNLTKNILLKETLLSNSTRSYINELSYQTILGTPIIDDRNRNPPVDSALNYVANVSGITIPHVTPQVTWRGAGFKAYENYYKRVLAVESYNQYILSDLYANRGNQLSTLQQDLIKKASSETWFKDISSTFIGVILRQILLFESQSFILLAESLKTQKQMLYTQAMTNSLLIANNSTNEEMLLRRAIIGNR